MLIALLAIVAGPAVLPGPPSSPIQPPGMICLGACAGPVVWGPAERGRLVVACDMRSDTCSDGRQITTTRATPVPCETSPGVWEMVPENTGCYSVHGLESWAANTSYLAYGAELDRSPWVVMSDSALTPLPGGGYRLCQTGSSINVGLNQSYSAGLQQGEWVTAAVIARPNTASAMLLSITSTLFVSPLPMTSEGWQRYSHSAAYEGSTQRFYIYPRPGGQKLCIDILAAWLTKTATPGRACWGGEAPVTCAADRHTISTEGWPTESGEIRVGVRLAGDASENRAIIYGGEGATFRLVIQTNNAIRLSWDGLNPTTAALPWEYGRTYVLKLVFAGTTISLYRDGVFIRDFTYSRPVEWAPVVRLGTTGTVWHLNGSISSLTVRSYEEVSP